MKRTLLLILLLGFAAVSSTSCSLKADDQSDEPASAPVIPDPIEILEERIETERDLRFEVQEALANESLQRERWQLAATALSVVALAGFLIGTTIGSRGRRHAAHA